MTAAWVVPTARTVPWGATVGVATCAAGTTVAAALTGIRPAGVLGVLAAALAAALVAGLRDPAADLLAAVPVSPARRRGRRQLLLVTAGLLLWLAVAAAAGRWAPGTDWPLGPVAALTATGFAVAAWVPGRTAVTAGVAAPIAWYAAARVGDGPLAAWQDSPWAVVAAAGTALLLGRNR